MAKITQRTIITYKWICTDKERCEQIDNTLEELVMHQCHLSSYVAEKRITGLECLSMDAKLKAVIKEFREERAHLWRRVRKETQETVTESDPVPMTDEVQPNV